MRSWPHRWMYGGCASWAIAFREQHPEMYFLLETEYDKEIGEETLLHVRVHDGERAWDALGWEPLSEIEKAYLYLSEEDLRAEDESLQALYGGGIIHAEDIADARKWIDLYYDSKKERELI